MIIGYYNFAAGSFNTRKIHSKLYSTKVEFYPQSRQIRFLSHPVALQRVAQNMMEVVRIYTYISYKLTRWNSVAQTEQFVD